MHKFQHEMYRSVRVSLVKYTCIYYNNVIILHNLYYIQTLSGYITREWSSMAYTTEQECTESDRQWRQMESLE